MSQVKFPGQAQPQRGGHGEPEPRQSNDGPSTHLSAAPGQVQATHPVGSSNEIGPINSLGQRPSPTRLDSPPSDDTDVTALGQPIDEVAPLKLKKIQHQALEYLAMGYGVKEIAETIHVPRSTIYRWLTHDPHVRAIYNRWKLSSFESAVARLVSIQDAAAEVVALRIINDHDHKLAARVLERMGVLSPATTSATDSARAAREIELERRQNNLDLTRRAEQIHKDGRFIDAEHRFEEPK